MESWGQGSGEWLDLGNAELLQGEVQRAQVEDSTLGQVSLAGLARRRGPTAEKRLQSGQEAGQGEGDVDGVGRSQPWDLATGILLLTLPGAAARAEG